MGIPLGKIFSLVMDPLQFGWLTEYRKLALSVAVPVFSLMVAALAASWSLKKRKKPIAMNEDGLTRPLGELDTWYAAKNRVRILPHFYVAATLSGKPWTLKEAQILFSRVLACHAPSMCTLVDHDDPTQPPYWRRLWHPSYLPEEQGVMDIHFETRATDAEDDVSWKALAQQHEAEVFSITSPYHTLIRLVIVSRPNCPYYEVILVPHHAVCDGRGGMFFLRQLLDEWSLLQAEDVASLQPLDLTQIIIGDGQLGDAVSSNSRPKHARWPTEMEALVHTTPSLWFLVKALIEDSLPMFRPTKKFWLGPSDRGALLKPTAEVAWLKISPTVVEAIRIISRTRGVTVNGALWAAITFGLFRIYRRHVKAGREVPTGLNPNDPSSAWFRLTSPVDLRSRLGVSEVRFSPMVVGSEFFAQASTKMTFWATAKSANENLLAGIPNGISTIGTIRWLPRPSGPWFAKREAAPPNGRRQTLEISNVGSLDFGLRYGDSILRDVYFGRHTVRDGHLFSVTAVTAGSHRAMNLCINATKELLMEGDLQILEQTITQVLTRVATMDPSLELAFEDLYDTQD